eukprot:CAMPEP_0180133196 /NCGR_PEP_ID=MMETSP0986-20121125/9404_1 /TAXON_ID=697907 /ORGANISM="non described non described, Strain CCMP2293" /LENGTH=339 /DNA_ID=CAMNT_0022073283 /DNA_START=21 /DNA_END=1040 /DNA_ORIENTATION=+
MTLLRIILVAMCAHGAIAFAPPATLPCSVSLRATQRPSALSLRAESLPFSRRAILAAGILGAASFSKTLPATAAAASDIDALRGELAALVKADPDFGPTLVRLAWHSSGTYDKMSKTGGSGGATIRFKEEFSHGANAGLQKAQARLESLKSKFPAVSYADLYTLAGVAAIETLGGPKVTWRSGRVDSMDPADVTPDGRLPDADKGESKKTRDHLREIFGRMGFDDQAIVALSGAHALGRCHADASGYVGPWSPTPTLFTNTYFTLLANLEWTPNTLPSGKFQYKDPSGKLMMLPSDIALIEDPAFKTWVEIYAKDEKRFFADFSKYFSALLELGTKNLA